MPHDVAYRHRTALDPSAITTITAGLHMISRAIEDCRRAGVPPDDDPAVLLLTRHLGTIAVRKAADGSRLRVRCMQAIGEIKASPSLRAIAAAGIAGNQYAKNAFHREARAALRRFAFAFGYVEADFDVSTNMADISVGGESSLHSDELFMQVSADNFGQEEILFRRCRSRKDYCGFSNNWASLRELENVNRFASRIRLELGFPSPVSRDRTLFA